MNQDHILDKPVREEFGLKDIRCDGQSLYKVNGQGAKVFDLPLTNIKDLMLERCFSFSLIWYALLYATASVLSYLYIETGWLKWTVVVVGGMASLGSFLDPYKKHIYVTTVKQKFKLEVDDDDSDIKGFVAAVKMVRNSPVSPS